MTTKAPEKERAPTLTLPKKYFFDTMVEELEEIIAKNKGPNGPLYRRRP